MYQILLISIVVISCLLIFLVLMQQGKGADAGAAFGSGASGTVFGAQGAGTFLSRTTAVLATLFFLNCLGLAWLIANKTSGNIEEKSVIDTAIESGTIQDLPNVPVVAPGQAPDGDSLPADLPTIESPAPADLPSANSTVEAVGDAASEAVGVVTEQASELVDDASEALNQAVDVPTDLPVLEAPVVPELE